MSKMSMRRNLAIAAIAIALVASPAMAQTDKQCKTMASCMRGGPISGTKCTIKEEICPPCVVFSDGGCYDKNEQGACNFGDDCEDVFTAALNGGGSTTTDSASGDGSTATPSPSPSDSINSTSSQSSSGAAGSNAADAGAATSTDSGPDMALVIGIVGACIVIIAVAAIFFVLVRRSRAGDDEDDEMTPTAQVVTKAQPPTTSNAVSYAPYAQRSGANPTTPTSRVVQYYNDNALPSPHGGRGGGGFGSQQQNQPPVKTVRPAGAANAPTFFKPPTATAAPASTYSAQPPVAKPQSSYGQQNNNAQYANQPQNMYGNNQLQSSYSNQSGPMYGNQQQPVYANNAPSYTPAPVYTPAPAPVYTAQPAVYAQPAEPLFTVHAADEQPPPVVRRESSPRPRRESYEF